MSEQFNRGVLTFFTTNDENVSVHVDEILSVSTDGFQGAVVRLRGGVQFRVCNSASGFGHLDPVDANEESRQHILSRIVEASKEQARPAEPEPVMTLRTVTIDGDMAGYFHRWTELVHCAVGDGSHLYTEAMAVVEDENGVVNLYRPTEIVFADRTKRGGGE